jgi:all-trans-retinol 13,14-reductase
MKTCVIIGGGIGGLVTGALLAKEGYRVTVLEKNAIIGGGLQNFERHGVNFPTGMHIFGGFQKGGNLRRIFSYLGVLDKISLRPMDEEASDVVTMMSEGKTYRLPRGKDRFIAYLSGCFPTESAAIEAYINRLFELSEEEDLFYLRETPENQLSHSEDFLGSVSRLMDRYITDPKLKDVLTYLSPLFGSDPQTTPAYIHALLSTLHINGTFQFVDGSQQLADALVEVIEKAGGRVLANKEVVRIAIENHQITGVYTREGQCYQADSYISDVHPDVLLRIIDPQAFTAAFKTRIQSVPETLSSFKVFIKFKDKAFPYLNHSRFCMSDGKDGPQRLMFVTPPVAHQGEYAATMVILTPMVFSEVKAWENTTKGHRGDAYKQWKLAMKNKVLDGMEQLYPKFRDTIEFAFAASPLTIRDYYGNKEGSNYGFRKDCNNLMLSQMSVATKVKNLFLTGQNVNIHGLCGVSLTAIETAEALVGHNTIVRKINESR